jgi:hypothetical protein
MLSQAQGFLKTFQYLGFSEEFADDLNIDVSFYFNGFTKTSFFSEILPLFSAPFFLSLNIMNKRLISTLYTHS